MRVVEAADVKVEERRWLIESLWPESGVGFLAGAPKSGKSHLAVAIASAVGRGAKFLGALRCRAGRVVMMVGEDRLEEVGRRLDLAGGRSGVQLVEGASMNDAVELSRGCDLLIIDPLVRFLSNESLGCVRPALAMLRGLGCSVLVVHHMRKGGVGGEGMRGSSELHAWGEVNLYLNGGELSVESRMEAPTSFKVSLVHGTMKLAHKRVIGRGISLIKGAQGWRLA